MFGFSLEETKALNILNITLFALAYAVVFNIQIRELDVGKLSIDLRKWVCRGKRIV